MEDNLVIRIIRQGKLAGLELEKPIRYVNRRWRKLASDAFAGRERVSLSVILKIDNFDCGCSGARGEGKAKLIVTRGIEPAAGHGHMSDRRERCNNTRRGQRQ